MKITTHIILMKTLPLTSTSTQKVFQKMEKRSQHPSLLRKQKRKKGIANLKKEEGESKEGNEGTKGEQKEDPSNAVMEAYRQMLQGEVTSLGLNSTPKNTNTNWS